MPECLEKVIGAENPVRFIRVYLENLDLVSLGFTRSKHGSTRRPSYGPATLLMLYLYGYLNRVRSSRRLQTESRRITKPWWLLGRLTPDHNTISDFRMENGGALGKIFKRFVRDCVLLGLADGKQVCVDGTPIRVVNAMDRATNVELAAKNLAYEN